MFTKFGNFIKGLFEGTWNFIKGIWDFFKEWAGYIWGLLAAILLIFKDIIDFILEMLQKVIGAFNTLINLHVNTNIINSGDNRLMAFADRFIPLHETFTFLETFGLIYIAVMTIRVARFIKKTFWAA